MNNKEYVESIDERLSGDLEGFKRARYYKCAEQWIEQEKLKSALCIKGFTVVNLIDDNNAILKENCPKIPEAPYTVVVEGKQNHRFYVDIEQALLGWLGHSEFGSNEHYCEFAYRALKG